MVKEQKIRVQYNIMMMMIAREYEKNDVNQTCNVSRMCVI